VRRCLCFAENSIIYEKFFKKSKKYGKEEDVFQPKILGLGKTAGT